MKRKEKEMLYFAWKGMSDIVIPKMGMFMLIVIDGMMPIILMCVAISVMLSVVGIRTGGVFGPIANAVVRGLGYIGRTVISAVGWCLRHLILFIPAFYLGIRNSFRRSGSNEFVANLVSLIATILLIVIII